MINDQTFVLSDQDGALVGHYVLSREKIICNPIINNSNYENSKFIHTTLESTITVISYGA